MANVAQRNQIDSGGSFIGWLLILPMIVVVAVICLAPLSQALQQAMQQGQIAYEYENIAIDENQDDWDYIDGIDVIPIAWEIDGVIVSVHGWATHGMDAWMVAKCIQDIGPNLELKNTDRNRKARVCYIPDWDKWGIQIITESGERVTEFVKNKMKNLDQVVKYLENRGYGL